MTDQSPEYLSGPEFDQLFNLAKYANLTRKERDMYNASLKYKWDNKNVRDYAAEQGREEGLKHGIEQGRELGEHKKAVEMALKLKQKKPALHDISNCYSYHIVFFVFEH